MSDLSKQDALDAAAEAAAKTAAQLTASAMNSMDVSAQTHSTYFDKQVKQFEEDVSCFGRKIDKITFESLCVKTQDPLVAIHVWKSFQDVSLQVLRLKFDLLALKQRVSGL